MDLYKNKSNQGSVLVKPEILRISEIPSKYPQQWVTVDITKRDKYGWPFEGRVVLHSKDRIAILDQLDNLGGDLYLFYSGSIDDINHEAA